MDDTQPNAITADPSAATSSNSQSTSSTSPSNPWDSKPLTFDAHNPRLPGQVYVACDGQARHALRGPEIPGNRERLAPLIATPLADGTDFAPSSDDFIPGFVFLDGDAALLAGALANPATVVVGPPRDFHSLKITPLSDAPDAPVTLHQDPAPSPVPAAAAPVTITADAHAKTANWISRLESRAVVLGHAADAEFMAGIAALRRLLGHR